MPDLQEVAVKVQRPGIKKIVEVDLEIMLHLATLMEKNIEELAFHQPVNIVNEFARTLEKELDYHLEAANTKRAAANFASDPNVCIPSVYDNFSTARVLTTAFVDGIKVSNIEGLNANGMDCKLITERGADILLRMIFDWGIPDAESTGS